MKVQYIWLHNFRYSYDYGLVHYIMISTEHNFSPGSPMYTWLEYDLRNVDRQKTPWVIIAGHRAMYCSTTDAGKLIELQEVNSISLKRHWVQYSLTALIHRLVNSWRIFLSYRNQSNDLQRKLMDWFLYEKDRRNERVEANVSFSSLSENISGWLKREHTVAMKLNTDEFLHLWFWNPLSLQ